ncbi:MAG TPA: mechanosensitive ion channel domain-containing protein [Candidatus Limnocylindrales bacterium]
MDIAAFYDSLGPAGRELLAIGLQLLLIAIATVIALRLSGIGVRAIISALLDREVAEGTAQELSAIEVAKRKATLEGLATTLLRVIILAIAFLMAMQAFHLDIGPAVAGLGIIGIAIGLGAQHLVRDYLAGAFVLIENQYARGDVVRIADVSGTVEDFSLRRTTLRDLDGTVHSVPNGLIGVASNLTRVWARINLDLTVAHGTDLEAASGVVNEIGRAMAADPAWKRRVLEAPRVDRVSSLAGEGVTLKILGSVRAADRWAATGELRKRIATAFAEQGIEIRGV